MAQALTHPNLPSDGMLVTSYNPVEESAHQLGRALHDIENPTRRADPAGTGLGLPIARQVAQAHHGSPRIADRPNGTCMVLRLPLSEPAD
ncbi:hypothetical protein HUT06_31710 [Actinomadura sp. NAK00032]|uniref:ATP-binding protein n=1 Tax=Actinomadura sp. NAK00032 TaxID=2742128 RepID=UPI001590FB8E|nr:ATP-binding protein [Actinomadura sp. NAK00032]QKW38004.1 hypothetical protein HUT06_31710 [Actinomadura sp. NAK00032]